MPSELDGGDRGPPDAPTECFMAVRIQRMSDEQAESVARLHIEGISGGFLSSLGPALLAEFRERRISLVRLIVMADLARPNAFYLQHGFWKAGQTDSHGRASNVLVIDTSQASEDPTERQDSH